jgi:ribosomal protein S18 acetylase RimI-like enzyme
LGSQRWSKDCGVLFCDKKKGKRIQAIYVLPGHQGKGIGGELMQKGLGFLGSGDIFIDVVSYNHKAISFYEKFGFRKTGKEFTNEMFRFPSGAILPEIEMVKNRD